MLENLSLRPVRTIEKANAERIVIERHYLHRKPSISHSFGLFDLFGDLVGACTFGTPPSRHLQKSACPSDPSRVIEMNRLWVDDKMPRNSESFFVRSCLKQLPSKIVVSYADTKEDHYGYIYRACGFDYAGWTDMDRKTPRYDYHVEGKHSRHAFRGESGCVRIERLPKVRYWTVTGDKRERRELRKLCGWPSMNWKKQAPPGEPDAL